MDTRFPSPAHTLLDTRSPAEKVLAVEELAALVVSKLTLETCKDAANFQLVCKALYNARGALRQGQWRALCQRVSPATASARACDGVGVDWYSLARALLVKRMGVSEHELSNYRLSVDIFFRGDAYYSDIFRLPNLVDEYFCYSIREDGALAAAPGDVLLPLPWSITSADLFNSGGTANSPFRAQAYLLNDDGAVALVASDLPPCPEPELDTQAAPPHCCYLHFNLTEQLSERMPDEWWGWADDLLLGIKLSAMFMVGEPRQDGDLEGLVRLVVPPHRVVAPADAQPLSWASYNYEYDETFNPCVVASLNDDVITPFEAAAKLQDLPWEYTS